MQTPLLAVLATLIIGLMSAGILDSLADIEEIDPVWLGAGLLVVLAINGLRLILWSHIHQRYPLSRSYPLTALFFPLVLGLGFYRGDSVTATQAIGVVLICLGVMQLSRSDIPSGPRSSEDNSL